MLEKTLESPLHCKEIKSVSPKGDQSWIFIGKTDAEAPILWPPGAENWLIRKDPVCWERLKAGGEGDDRGWDGWMASLTRWIWIWASCRSWWWTGSLACCSSWGHKESDTTERLNWTDGADAAYNQMVFWGAMQGVVPSLVQNWVSSWAKLVLSKYSRFLKIINPYILGFPGGASGKEPTYMQETEETCVPSLGWKDPLEEGMATHYSILAWRIPWT